MPVKDSEEFKANAVRLVVDHRADYGSEFEAMTKIAERLGMSAELLRRWVRQAEVDEGWSPGVTTTERAGIRELKRKNAELERTVEILKAATSSSCGSSTRHCADLPVHHLTPGPVGRRADLHGAQRRRVRWSV